MQLRTGARAVCLQILALAMPVAAFAQNAYLVRSDLPRNSPGTVVVSTVPATYGAFPVISFSQSFSRSVNGSALDKPQCGNVVIRKPTDVSSVGYLLKAVGNTAIPAVTLFYTTPGATAGTVVVPVKVVLRNVFVAEVTQGDDTAASNVVKLNDLIQLSATTFEVTQTQVLANGTLGSVAKFGWNCVLNTSVAF